MLPVWKSYLKQSYENWSNCSYIKLIVSRGQELDDKVMSKDNIITTLIRLFWPIIFAFSQQIETHDTGWSQGQHKIALLLTNDTKMTTTHMYAMYYYTIVSDTVPRCPFLWAAQIKSINNRFHVCFLYLFNLISKHLAPKSYKIVVNFWLK